MALGAKKVETRSWETSYRGWLAIQASKGGLSRADLEVTCFTDDHIYGALKDYPPFLEHIEASARRKKWLGEIFPHGHIVAVVRLQSCWPTGQLFKAFPEILTDRERAFGNYDPGRWAWITDDLFRLPEPIPFKAKQGLCAVPQAVIGEIVKQGWSCVDGAVGGRC